jgi:hypothetical protein
MSQGVVSFMSGYLGKRVYTDFRNLERRKK